MRRSLLMACWGLWACSGGGAFEAGAQPDAGTSAVTEVQCTGVPARLNARCVGLDTFEGICGPTREATLTQQFTACDAGVTAGECADLQSVRWVYGFPGDSYECFYAPDGGGLQGAINHSDHGVLAAGRVGECTPQAPPQCRDGG